MNTAFYKNILNDFLQYSKFEIEDIACGKKQMTLSVLDENQIISILRDTKKIFEKEPTMLNIKSPCIVIGDLHGHLLDLFRVIKLNGLPNKQKFVFLGDIVDRGEFSLETCLIVFLLKILYPTQVYIIRGNHEFHSMCCQFGFYKELHMMYKINVYDEFLDVFSYMPLSMVIDNTILCVHGGIGPGMNSIHQLSSIQKPITEYESSAIATALLWSDPSESISTFKSSGRGTGYIFGRESFNQFLKGVKKTVVIRGHECAKNGVESRFNGSIITVFTASNYCGLAENKAGVLIIQPGSKFEYKRYTPLQYLKRTDVIFKQMDSNSIINSNLNFVKDQNKFMSIDDKEVDVSSKINSSNSLNHSSFSSITKELHLITNHKNMKENVPTSTTPDSKALKMNVIKSLRFRRNSNEVGKA